METQSSAQSPFQKLNVDNSCQKTRKTRHYIFETLSNFTVFLYFVSNILVTIVVFDIHYKSSNSSSYVTYTSSHPPRTKNNISLSLTKRIVSIVANNRENRLKELKEHLREREHPQHIIDYSFRKIFRPKFQTENNDGITF